MHRRIQIDENYVTSLSNFFLIRIMKYRHIVSITGLGGLFQLLSTKNNGAFVKSLEDHSNKFISSRTHQVTPLESIEIYTQTDNIYLHEVFEKLKSVDDKIQSLDFKSNKDVANLFGEAVPEYDQDRVYTSDIKKMFKWYLLLKKNDLLDFSEYFEAANQTEEVEEAPVVEEAKPAKKAKAAKTKAATSSTDAPAEEAKPKTKKTATKKKAEPAADKTEEQPKPAKKAKATSTKKKKTEE